MQKKIAVLGHQHITKFVLENFIKNKINVDTIIGLDNSNSKGVSDFFDVKQYAKLNKINFFMPDKYSLKSTKCFNFFKKSNFDYLFVVGWSRLVPAEILSFINISTVGWHGGPYKPPRCRGRAVVNWAIIDGKKKFYVYAMSLKPGVDDGDLYKIDNVFINEHDNSKTAYFKMGIKVAEIYIEILKKNLKPFPQPKGKPTYLPKRSPENSGINWNQNIDDLYNFIRALSDPYPNAYTYMQNVKIDIKDAIPFEENKKRKPGHIYHIFHDSSFTVGCKNGLLLVKKYSCGKDLDFNINDKFVIKSGQDIKLKKY